LYDDKQDEKVTQDFLLRNTCLTTATERTGWNMSWRWTWTQFRIHY